MPEIHNQVVPIILEFLMTGNSTVRKEACRFLAKVIKYQHHIPYREELIQFIKQNLAVSSNFSLRRSFIEFCTFVVAQIPYDLFKKCFLEELLVLKKDPIESVRKELAVASPTLKPFLDRDAKDAMQLTEVLIQLIQDECHDVAESAEIAESTILQSRKKNKDKDFEKADKVMVEFQKKLAEREKIELEERKRRSEAEEENKYEMHSLLNHSHKKWRS
jgi:hypothetical protein